MFNMEVRNATPTPAVQVSVNSPADMESGSKDVESPSVADRMAISRTCPHAYGNRRVMEDVIPNVAADAIMRLRSGLERW